MRILGIDYGEARVGIAITDQLNITVQGLETIQRNGSDKVILRRLDEIFEKYEVDRLKYKPLYILFYVQNKQLYRRLM